ncbi:MAG: PEP-CTERM sorting domain-containing protein [Phycisphaerae bacterium]
MRYAISTCLAAGLLAGSAQAATVFDWGGNYVSRDTFGFANAVMVGEGLGTTSLPAGTTLFTSPDDDNYLTNVNATLAGPNAVGGFAVTSSDGQIDLSRWRIDSKGQESVAAPQDDKFVIQATRRQEQSSASTFDFGGYVLFEQGNAFASGFQAGQIELDSLAVNIENSPNVVSARALIRDGSGNLFVSSTSRGTAGLLDIADADAETWLTFDPSISFTNLGAAGSPNLDDITGVGFAIIGTGITDGTATGNRFRIDIDGITATGAIPEPATLSLLGLAGGMIGRRRR